MNLTDELVGKEYPVTSVHSNDTIGYKVITKAQNCSNVAGVVIWLDNNDTSPLFLSYMAASKLNNKGNE